MTNHKSLLLITDYSFTPMKKLILVFTLVFVLSACGDDHSADSHTTPADVTIQVDAKDFSFAPATLDVTAGKTVMIDLKNTGAVEHDFTIRTIKLAGKAESHGNADSHMHTAGESAVHVAAKVGTNGTVTFTPTEAGTYQFECSVPGHKEAGMVGTFVVK